MFISPVKPSTTYTHILLKTQITTRHSTPPWTPPSTHQHRRQHHHQISPGKIPVGQNSFIIYNTLSGGPNQLLSPLLLNVDYKKQIFWCFWIDYIKAIFRFIVNAQLWQCWPSILSSQSQVEKQYWLLIFISESTCFFPSSGILVTPRLVI